MFTPILNPNSPSSTNANPNSVSSMSQYQIELGKILLKHDPNAVRLYDFINHVKVCRYNLNESRWENHSYIEGNLFFYKRQQIINNVTNQCYAFAIINQEHHFVQPISSNMLDHADKLCLFYEIKINDKPHVFSLHFINEKECLRLHTFINQTIQNIKEQPNHTNIIDNLRHKQTNVQIISANVHRQPTTVNIQNPVISQYESSRQTPVHITARQSTPLVNSNTSTNDPTISLKRLLNIPSQNGLDNESGLSSQQIPINLLPPSAFESISETSSSSINVDHSTQVHTSNLMNREHFRNVLLHLVQNNDQFLDIIHQAYFSHHSTQ